MSQKWIRSKKWDDEHIPGWAWPVRWVLRALSSIPLAVFLLLCVSMYGTLASVPIGLIALAPTYVLYGLSLLLAVGVIAVLPVRVALSGLRRQGVSPAWRFALGFVGGILLMLAGVWLWHRFAWPVLRYDTATGRGLRLFAGFVAQNSSITVRRLPGMEMSELEFYGWWPLKVLLVAFVLNMIVATVRRIEFVFPNIGVLTVHSGIVVLALGSMYYSSLKEEGDMLLEAGAADSSGNPTPGRPESGFYDNTRVALWAGDGTSWRQLSLRGVPRYHDYNLNALNSPGMDDWARVFDEGRTLSVPVANRPPAPGIAPRPLDELSFRVVGYAPYAHVGPQWIAASPAEVAALTTPAVPVRNFEVVMKGAGDSLKISDRTQLFPTIPAGRVQQIGLGMMLEYTSGMSAQRWSDLTTPTPAGSTHSLIIEVPGPGGPDSPPYRTVVALGDSSAHALGETGYTIETVRLLPSLQQLLAESREVPVAIEDPLYAGADTSVAVIKINPPASVEPPYLRFVFHRFPDQSIDIVQTRRDPASGVASALGRRAANPAIRLSYLDESAPQYYIDEAASPAEDPGNPPLRGVFRPRGGGDGKPVLLEGLKPGFVVSLGPMAGLRIAERWAHAASIEYPVPVPLQQRDNKELGTHRHAALAVEVSRGEWKQTLWLPFAQYALVERESARAVRLADGAVVTLLFGRVMRTLPDLQLQLADFKMYSHDFGGPTQDFRSDLVVLRQGGTQMEVRHTSLNDPLLVRVPFQPRPDVPAPVNFVRRLVSYVVPTQYKFSQAGWDPEGWNATQAEVDAGTRTRALARWTILGVGNNPGIYVVATGAVMMVLGIPWAFYIKPIIIKHRKRKIQASLAAARAEPRDSAPASGGVAAAPRTSAAIEDEDSSPSATEAHDAASVHHRDQPAGHPSR